MDTLREREGILKGMEGGLYLGAVRVNLFILNISG